MGWLLASETTSPFGLTEMGMVEDGEVAVTVIGHCSVWGSIRVVSKLV